MKIALSTLAAASIVAAAFADAPPTEAHEPSNVVDCETVDLAIYFEDGTADLTDAAKRVIENTSDQLAGCAVTEMDATAISADAQAVSLSEARAASVIQALSVAGVEATETTTDIVLRRVSSGADTPIMARRVELSLTTKQAWTS